MLCTACQRTVPDDAVFCCYCGVRLVRRQTAPTHQRANGEGYAYRRGKTWTAVYTYGWRADPDGVSRRMNRTKGGFHSKAEALAYCLVLKAEAEPKKKAPSLSDYWTLYLNGEYEQLSRNRQVAYKIAWNKLQALHARPVDSLTVQDLRSVVNEKASTYYPAKDMKTVLAHLFRLAAADRWTSKDLPEFIILPELHAKERQPFTAEEQASLWRVYDAGDRRAALPLIMIYTGMMPGEMQDLKIDMIDFPNQRITDVGLKTAVRKAAPIYLPDAIIPVLADEAANTTSLNGYVWPRTTDKFYTNYYAALEAAGCRRLEPYSCRHTTATALAVTEGVAPQTIKKIMRWSTTKMLDVYAHPDDSDAREAINRLGR